MAYDMYGHDDDEDGNGCGYAPKPVNGPLDLPRRALTINQCQQRDAAIMDYLRRIDAADPKGAPILINVPLVTSLYEYAFAQGCGAGAAEALATAQPAVGLKRAQEQYRQASETITKLHGQIEELQRQLDDKLQNERLGNAKKYIEQRAKVFVEQQRAKQANRKPRKAVTRN